MKIKLFITTMMLTVLLFGVLGFSGPSGSKLIGEWVNDTKTIILDIIKTGESFTIVDMDNKKYPATLQKDGTLVMKSPEGNVIFSYVKESDTMKMMDQKFKRCTPELAQEVMESVRKSKVQEITNAMGAVMNSLRESVAVNGSSKALTSATEIQDKLGIGVTSIKDASAWSVSACKGAKTISAITATSKIKGAEGTIILKARCGDGRGVWSGTISPKYLPKN
jgi:hypothetical protein